MEKIKIKNRKGLNVVVVVERVGPQKGLAFVMHGLSGFKEQPHIQTIADAFRESGYTVVRFDTTNTFGESDGDYENATTTNYYEDLEDVIKWAETQAWYEEPFALAGHSLGGICTALFTEEHSGKVKGLAPISTVVSGKLSVEARPKEELEEWEKTGWLEEDGESKPGLIKRLKWSHMEDRLKYDLLPMVRHLIMPVLLIVGEKDGSTPPEHQKILFDALPNEKKELHIIKGAPHTFRDPKHLQEIKSIFLKWIKSLETT